MARYLFHTLTAAACLAMVAGPNVCFAANGADAGGGAASKTKAKTKAAPADKAPAPAAAAAPTPPADAGGGAAAPAETVSEAEGAESITGGAGDDTLFGGAGNDTLTAEEAAPEAPSLADPASLGFAKIRHPGGATSVSHGGQVYEADKAGNITVPLTAVEDLVSHGFELV